MIDLFFSDPVIETAVIEEPAPLLKKSGFICCHCHREIVGRVHHSGNLYFDDYCWSLRYILEAQRMAMERYADMKRQMGSDDSG